ASKIPDRAGAWWHQLTGPREVRTSKLLQHLPSRHTIATFVRRTNPSPQPRLHPPRTSPGTGQNIARRGKQLESRTNRSGSREWSNNFGRAFKGCTRAHCVPDSVGG